MSMKKALEVWEDKKQKPRVFYLTAE